MRAVLSLAVIPLAAMVALIAFVVFSIGMTAEWLREASAIKAPVFISAAQRARRLRRRI